MVELKVDVPADVPLSDCFVSVRVGETQKLSRLSGSKTYSFPQAGDRRYGKIEVYKRIGSCGVDVDPINEGTRQVQIGCGAAGTVRLNVDVNPNGKTQATKPAFAEKEEKASSKSKVAKEYLRKHSLELQLSEAMQAVLRATPDDPVKFLCEMLMKNVTSGGVALPASQGQKEANTPAPAAAVAKAPTVQMLPFQKYHSQHFGTLNGGGFASIYSKFASRVVPAPAPANAKEVSTPHMLPFKEYHFQHFGSLNGEGFASIYSKFPSQVATAAAPAKAKEGLRADAIEKLRIEACQSLEKAAESGKLGAALGLPKAPAACFAKRPSVGSWLIPLPHRPSADEAPAAQVSKPTVVDTPAAETLATAEVAPAAPAAMRTGQAFAVSSGVFGASMQLGLGPRMILI